MLVSSAEDSPVMLESKKLKVPNKIRGRRTLKTTNPNAVPNTARVIYS